MTLSIAFFGSSLVSAYWNGAATYFRGLLHALPVLVGLAALGTDGALEEELRHTDEVRIAVAGGLAARADHAGRGDVVAVARARVGLCAPHG